MCLDIPHQWGLGFVFSTSSLQALQDIPGSSCAFLASLRTRYFPRSPGSVTGDGVRDHDLDFSGGPVVKNLPASAGDKGSFPGLERFHMPRGN